jgi:uncharacterized protein
MSWIFRRSSKAARRKPISAFNVLGEPLEICSIHPHDRILSGWLLQHRTRDVRSHTVCVVMTAEFLEFSKSRGNDLSTAVPEFGFPGLNPGDRWCLCAPRWQEAFEADQAPRVVLRATHEGALSRPDIAGAGATVHRPNTARSDAPRPMPTFETAGRAPSVYECPTGRRFFGVRNSGKPAKIPPVSLGL